MRRFVLAAVCAAAVWWCGACKSSSAAPQSASAAISQGIVVTVSHAFRTIEAGNAPVTLNASVSGDSHNMGVSWTLSVANTGCSPACGTLKVTSNFEPNLTAVYAPPAQPPLNSVATITVRSQSDAQQVFVFNFQITAPITVSIGPKFSSQTVGGPAVNISATLANDVTSSSVSWTLTSGGAGGTSCAPACGTLTIDSALAVHYTPPATPPTGGSASPTIAATSNADPNKQDSFTFTLATPPIVVTIMSSFTFAGIGAPAITVTAAITNDFANSGVSWALTAGGMPCAQACGTLTANAGTSLSIAYTPPATAPAGANAKPTLTATAVADSTKAAGFSFNIIAANSFFQGAYIFSLRGYDSNNAPMALTGSIASDGNGALTAGELDFNDHGAVTSIAGPLTGTYMVDISFSSIPRVTINIVIGSATVTLKGSLSSDGKRGNIIQLDGTQFLTAGTLLQQDPTALANPGGNYAFQLDSDAGSNGGVAGRIVEAGQIILASGATGVTGGIADAGQSGTGPLYGGLSGPAPLDAGATATAPDASGRGTLTLSFGGNANTYAYYIVDAQQLSLIETDSGGTFQTVQSGTAQRQATFDANSINGAGVVALTGSLTDNSSGAPVLTPNVVIGQLVISGGTSTQATLDANRAGRVLLKTSDAGIIPVAQVPSTAFDPTTGRCLIAHSPPSASFVDRSAVYLYAPGKGFLVDVSVGAINSAFSGSLIPQSPATFTSADLAGNMIAHAGPSPALPSATIPTFNADLAVNFAASASAPSPGSGNYTAEIDLSTSELTVGNNGQVLNQPLPAQPFTIENDTTPVGHGFLSVPGALVSDANAFQTDVAGFYIIDQRHLVAIGLGQQGGGGAASTILFLEPQ